MLQKVRSWIAAADGAFAELTMFEQKVIAIGCGVIAFLCVLQPTIIVSLIRLMGVAACLVAAYAAYHICEREKAAEAQEDKS